MDIERTGVFVLFILLMPVSCKDLSFSEPLICYILDGFLIIYCLIVTALYFRDKLLHVRFVEVGVSQDNKSIYQQLEKPTDADPYQVLEPSKRKRKVGKKKKPQSADAEARDPQESLVPFSLPVPPRRPPVSADNIPSDDW